MNSNAQNDDFLGINQEVSPFSAPNEEQVFITREAEKQKKKEAKMASKHLKIWDKKTSTSRQPLRRIRDGDINPLQSDENIYNFNAGTRGFISAACLISKSRVQYPTEQRQQGIDEFVNQKKEMFLVQLANNTIENEIKNLELKKSRKHYALQDSSLALEKDSEKLMNFIEEDNMKTKRKQKDAEIAGDKRKAAEKQITLLEQQIHNQNSEIDKNEDLLKSLENHKMFLFHIFKLQNPKWLQNQLDSRKRKLNKIKERWIAQAKMNKDSQGDEEDLLNEFSKPDATANSQSGSLGETKKSKKSQNISQKQMTDADWDAKFYDLLEKDLIDVPEDYYDEKILFEEPEQLMEIFHNIEERNLEIIKKSQESETTLEMRKQMEIKTMKDLGGQVETQQQNYDELVALIKQANITLTDLRKQTGGVNEVAKKKKKNGNDKEDEDEEPDIDYLMADVRKDIERIYKILDTSSTLDAKPGIEILQDIELKLNDKISKMRYIHDHSKDFYLKLKLEVERRKELKADQAKEKTENERIKKKEEMMLKLQNKETMRPKKFGKPTTTRSEKPKIKKTVQKKVVDEETKDQQDYLGIELKLLEEQAALAQSQQQ